MTEQPGIPSRELAVPADAIAVAKPKTRGGKSLVAGANAWMRAKESERPEGDRILFDPWARSMAERDWRIQAIRVGRFLIPPLRKTIDQLQTAHCVRHASIDSLVCRAVERDGFEQIVTIGAGYDMRPYRFGDRLRGARWFECDHPGTHARKCELVEGLGNRSVDRVPVDLCTESLSGALARTTFSRQAPTVFVLEGLIHYLSMAQLEALLDAIASAAGRVRVVFSYIRSDMYERKTSTFVWLVKAVHEIPKLHFSDEEIEARCARHRLVGFSSWSFDDQIAEFVPALSRRARLSQDVAQVDAD